jgi:hypothetical protein
VERSRFFEKKRRKKFLLLVPLGAPRQIRVDTELDAATPHAPRSKGFLRAFFQKSASFS